MGLNRKSNPFIIPSPLSDSKITSPDWGNSANDISHNMHTPLNAKAKPFVMIKNFDINAIKGNINILSANTNLPMGGYDSKLFCLSEYYL